MGNSNRNQRRYERYANRDWNDWNDRSGGQYRRNYESDFDRPYYTEGRARFGREFNQSHLNRGPSNQWGNYRNFGSTHDYGNPSSAYFGNRSYPYGNYEMENMGNREYQNYPEREYPRFDRSFEQRDYDQRYQQDQPNYNRFGNEENERPRWPMSNMGNETYNYDTRRGRYEMNDMNMREGEHRGKGPRGYLRSDERIKEDVNDRLSDNPFIDATEIEVTVSNGEVTLTGSVDDRSDKRMAEDIAEAISGVKNVENKIRVISKSMGGQQSTTTPERSEKTTPAEKERTSRSKSNHFVES
jgi:hypothetical protein